MPLAYQDCRQDCRSIFDAALKAADPAAALRGSWAEAWRQRGIDPAKGQPTLVLAIGKCSVEMAAACLDLLGRPATATIVAAVPERARSAALPIERAGNCRVMEADHPIPGNRSFAAALAIQEAVGAFARDHGEKGLLIGLVSGGGSSHLTLPAGNLTVEDLAEAGKSLQSGGATIFQINCIRRHTEVLKGGRLGALTHPARVQVFVASDVIGDPLDVIASGPFAADSSTYAEALAIADRFRLIDRAPAVVSHLRKGALGQAPEMIRPGDPVLRFIHQTVICNNQTALAAAAGAAAGQGFLVTGCGPMAQPSAALEARRLVRGAIADADAHPAAAIARLVGGEPTVDTRDARGRAGVGGPSQELALAAALELRGAAWHEATGSMPGHRMVVASLSTDGIDGPTDAAGAIIPDDLMLGDAWSTVRAREHLAAHDSHTFLDGAGCLLRTGPTGINANHIALALAYPRP